MIYAQCIIHIIFSMDNSNSLTCKEAKPLMIPGKVTEDVKIRYTYSVSWEVHYLYVLFINLKETFLVKSDCFK